MYPTSEEGRASKRYCFLAQFSSLKLLREFFMFKARLRAPAIAIVAIVFASVLASPAQAASTKYPLTVKFGGYTTTIAKKPAKPEAK